MQFVSWLDKALSKNWINQFLFSAWIVIINATVPWIISNEEKNFSVIGKILGVIFWILLMWYSVRKYNSINNRALRISLLYGYSIKTVFAIFCGITLILNLENDILIIPDFISGMLSVTLLNFLIPSWWSFQFEPQVSQILGTFLITVVDGWILNLFTLLLSFFMLLFVKNNDR